MSRTIALMTCFQNGQTLPQGSDVRSLHGTTIQANEICSRNDQSGRSMIDKIKMEYKASLMKHVYQIFFSPVASFHILKFTTPLQNNHIPRDTKLQGWLNFACLLLLNNQYACNSSQVSETMFKEIIHFAI